VHAEDDRLEVIGLDADWFDWFGFDQDDFGMYQ